MGTGGHLVSRRLQFLCSRRRILSVSQGGVRCVGQNHGRWRFSLPSCTDQVVSGQLSAKARNRTGGIGEGLVFAMPRVKSKELAGAGNSWSTTQESSWGIAMVGPGSGVFPCATERNVST